MSRRKKCIFCRVFCMYRKITDSYNDICSKGKNRRYRNDKENINPGGAGYIGSHTALELSVSSTYV